MSRTNIFELLKQSNNMEKDADRLKTLLCEYHYAATAEHENYTLFRFIDAFCFDDWTAKGRCLDLQDFFETLGIDELDYYFPRELDDLLVFIEILYNFWYLAENYISSHKAEFELYDTSDVLKTLMDECLSEYNQRAYYFPEEEKCIIAEDSPQVTAAAEATEPEIALDIVRYNHRQLTGEVAKKKAILKTLGDYLEGRKREITDINSALYNTITGALNNLNIRHNNIARENKSYYHEAVADMPQEELEQHYDDLYQLILLAILEIDNVVRKREMNALIQRVSAKKS